MQPKFKLFHYWRSSSSWRVRWALAIKNIPWEGTSIDLLTDEVESPEHLARNPLGYVPVLEIFDPSAGKGPSYLAESIAIIEYLEELFPKPSILQGNAFERARIRQLAEIINSGTQPLQNPSVAAQVSQDPAEQKKWNAYWICRGLEAYQTLCGKTAGKLSFGDTVTLADLYLIPQCYNAERHGVQLESFPLIQQIYRYARDLPSCQASSPETFAPKSS